MKNYEQDRLDINGFIEPSKRTIESFIDFTKKILKGENRNRDFDIEWEDQMNILYGNEELLRITKDERYRGVPGIRESLTAAYIKGGLSELKQVFLHQTLEHTTAANMGEIAQIAFEKIRAYK